MDVRELIRRVSQEYFGSATVKFYIFGSAAVYGIATGHYINVAARTIYVW